MPKSEKSDLNRAKRPLNAGKVDFGTRNRGDPKLDVAVRVLGTSLRGRVLDQIEVSFEGQF